MAYYQIQNLSYDTAIQFNSPYDYNLKECLTITPRGYIGGDNGILGNYFTSVEYGKDRLLDDIFTFAESHPNMLAITKDGNAIDRASYKQDFP